MDKQQAAIDRTIAFLGTQPLPPPDDTAGALPQVQVQDVSKPNDLGQSAPAGAAQEAPKPEVQAQTPAPSLADAIRADREARQRAAQFQTKATQAEDENKSLKVELERYKKLAEIDDPLEYIRARNFPKELQAAWGQAFLYELKPEVAPPEFRLELYKAQQVKKEKEQAEARQRQEEEQRLSTEQQQIQQYAGVLSSTARSFAPGSYPDSEAWFTSDNPDPQGVPVVDHDAYAQSLLATARNLSVAAAQTGQQADLSPANVARVLEQEVQRRLGRRDRVVAARGKKIAAPEAPTSGQGKQPPVSPSGNRDVGAGGPRPPAKTEDERVQRAMEAMYSPK